MDFYNKYINNYLKIKYKFLTIFKTKLNGVNPWAFIRAYNEIETISITLKTIVGGGLQEVY